MAISFTTLVSEFPQELILGVVHNHAGWDTVTIKHYRQNIMSPTLRIHGMAHIPAKAGAKDLYIDVTMGGFCPRLKSVTKKKK